MRNTFLKLNVYLQQNKKGRKPRVQNVTLNTMEDKSKNTKEDKSKKGKNSSSVSPAIFFLPPLHV